MEINHNARGRKEDGDQDEDAGGGLVLLTRLNTSLQFPLTIMGFRFGSTGNQISYPEYCHLVRAADMYCTSETDDSYSYKTELRP